jgi:hypothetical protein
LSFPKNKGRFRRPQRTFARDEMMPNARAWDEGEIFPVDALRKAACTRFWRHLMSRKMSADLALSRLDAALIFEELAQGWYVDRCLYLDPQHGGMDDRRLRQRGGAQKISAEALHHETISRAIA